VFSATQFQDLLRWPALSSGSKKIARLLFVSSPIHI
jgi:hypothetical protein